MFEKIQEGAFPKTKIGTTTTIGEIISSILPFVFSITGILLLVYLIMGGLQLMFAAGDPKRVQAAWGKVTNALIGFVIIFISYWLVALIGKIFGLDIVISIFGK